MTSTKHEDDIECENDN